MEHTLCSQAKKSSQNSCQGMSLELLCRVWCTCYLLARVQYRPIVCFSIADASILVREGALFETAKFIDTQTDELTVSIVLFAPDVGVLTLISVRSTFRSRVKVDYTVEQFQVDLVAASLSSSAGTDRLDPDGALVG